jgi:hypothetical protein
MWRVSCILLLLALNWGLPTLQKATPDLEICSCPVLMENQDIFPFALQYRKHLCQLVESWAVLPAGSGKRAHDADPTILTQGFWERVVPPLRFSDPCYGLMSLQL